jgi:hypothetical protein
MSKIEVLEKMIMYLPNCKKRSPIEANVHYRVHKIPKLDYILNQMKSIHIITPNFFKISFNIINK